jgi:hypothetical protein
MADEERRERVDAVRVAIEDFAQLVAENIRLGKKVDELQKRGTDFMLERQEARVLLRKLSNDVHPRMAKEVLDFFAKYPT